MKSFFNTTFFQPLYNALVFLANTVPGHSLGLSIIALTIAVRLVLLPFTHTASQTQSKLKALEPELKAIKSSGLNKDEQAKKTLELYRANKINPFGGLVPILIQIPILLALFFVFRDGIQAHSNLLYSFSSLPETLNATFLGIDLTQWSIVLAILLFGSQFYQARLTVPKIEANIGEASFKNDMARSMNLQMRYVLPVMIALISLSFPAAVALYWLSGNIFTIGYELWRRR